MQCWTLGSVCACLLELRPRGSMVLQGSLIMSAPGILWNTTCLHKWWETLKGSIFGVKPSSPALIRPRGGLVVTAGEKASLLCCQFDTKQCREQFVIPCLVSPSLGVILWPSKLLFSCVCFLILILMGVLILWVVFPLFQQKVADVIAAKLSIFLRLISLGSFQPCNCHSKECCISWYGKLPTHQQPPFCPRLWAVSFSQALEFLRKIWFSACCSVCLKERSGLHWCTAYHISLPSEVLRCRGGVLFRSTRLKCIFWLNESQWFLFKLKSIGVGGCVLSICREFLSDHWQRVVVDSNRFRSATGKCVGFSSVYHIYLQNVWAGWEDYLPLQMTPHYWQLFASQGFSC